MVQRAFCILVAVFFLFGCGKGGDHRGKTGGGGTDLQTEWAVVLSNGVPWDVCSVDIESESCSYAAGDLTFSLSGAVADGRDACRETLLVHLPAGAIQPGNVALVGVPARRDFRYDASLYALLLPCDTGLNGGGISSSGSLYFSEVTASRVHGTFSASISSGIGNYFWDVEFEIRR